MIKPPDCDRTHVNRPKNNLSAACKLASPITPQHFANRYELRSILAQGGMGVVHSGWDHVLNRPIAVKTLLNNAATPPSIKRFEYEAHITGLLQHPSIPPVHDMGLTDNGLPYLVMKLIQGKTLDELIRLQYTATEVQLRTPSSSGESGLIAKVPPTAESGKSQSHHGSLDTKLNVLGIIEAIAQAIGYAHSQGVIHRDLKPQNIMVGAFGEVQVMDWGLAKFRGDAETLTSEPAIDHAMRVSHARTVDSKTNTSDGAILGTPAYMSPEQANGAIEAVTERSDVFGLGGLLCAMLTGKPPFLGSDGESTRQLAEDGNVDAAFARLDGCKAEPDLIALAKQCLSLVPSHRPANGNEVAKIVAKLRVEAEERAKQAEIGKAQSETRRRVLLWSVTAVFAVLVAGLTISLIQCNRAVAAEAETAEQLARTIAAESATADQLVKTQAEQQRAVRAELAAKAKTQEVQDTLAIVQQRTKIAQDAYGDFVFDIQNLLQNRPDTQELRLALLEKARSGLTKILDDARKQGSPDNTLAWSHFRMGDVELQLGNTLAAQKEFQAGYERAKQLFDTDPTNAQTQHDLCVSYNNLGAVQLRLGEVNVALDFYEKALALRLQLADADPKNAQVQRELNISYRNLGDISRQLGRTNAALEFYQKSNTLCQRLADADPKSTQARRDLSISYNNLGEIYRQLGRTNAALEFYEKFNTLCQQLVDADPKSTQAQRELSYSYHNLGDISRQLGRTNAASEFYEKFNTLCQQLVDADPKNTQAQRDLNMSYRKLGDISRQLGRTNAALEFYQKFNTLCQRLADGDPKNAQAQRDLCISYQILGNVKLQLGELNAAWEFHEKFNTLCQQLANADPNDAQAQRDLSYSYRNLGDTSWQLGRTNAALEFYQKFNTLCQRLADADPKNAQAQRDLSISYSKLGDGTFLLGQTKAALEFYQKFNTLCQQLADADPKSFKAQRDLCISYDSLGDVTLQLGQMTAALEFYEKARAVRQRLADVDPKNAQSHRDLFVSHYKFGIAHEKRKEFAEAIGSFEKSLAIAEKFERPEFFTNEVKTIEKHIAACQAKLNATKREAAPPPRIAK